MLFRNRTWLDVGWPNRLGGSALIQPFPTQEFRASSNAQSSSLLCGRKPEARKCTWILEQTGDSCRIGSIWCVIHYMKLLFARDCQANAKETTNVPQEAQSLGPT